MSLTYKIILFNSLGKHFQAIDNLRVKAYKITTFKE